MKDIDPSKLLKWKVATLDEAPAEWRNELTRIAKAILVEMSDELRDAWAWALDNLDYAPNPASIFLFRLENAQEQGLIVAIAMFGRHQGRRFDEQTSAFADVIFDDELWIGLDWIIEQKLDVRIPTITQGKASKRQQFKTRPWRLERLALPLTNP